MAAEPTSSNPWWRLYLPALIGMLVTVFLSLALSTYFAAKRSGPVVDMSKRISDIAIPSVLHLSALRGHLRTLERQMRVGAAGEPLDLDALRVATQDIDSESGVYGELRHSPAERERWDATSRSIVSLLDKVETLRYQRTHASTLGTESFLAARGEATSALENVRELINLHTRDAQDAAVRIEQVEHLYTTLSSGLTVLTVIVFLVVAATAARLIRRHVLMEQVRISELELFASRVAHDIRGPLGPVLFALQPTSASQLDDATSRSIARGSRAAHRIVDIVDGLYEFAMAGARPTVGVTCVSAA
jgi:signal transduction histidine kinase